MKNPNDIINSYENLTRNLLEEDPGTEDNVFENLVKLTTNPTDPESTEGLQDYLDDNHGKVEFASGEGAGILKAVLVDSRKEPGSVYRVTDSKLRLVVAVEDMVKSGYEEADVDESGNLNIDYSEIVRYENWIKK